MLSLLIGPLLAPRAFSRRPLSVDRRPPVMTYKANTRQARRPKKGRPTPRRPEMEFFLTVAFLINDVERRFHYQYDSFQECSQAREVMVKDETRRPLWATCTSGKAPPPSVYQKEFQDQLMPGQLLKGALGLEKKKRSDMCRTPYSEANNHAEAVEFRRYAARLAAPD